VKVKVKVKEKVKVSQSGHGTNIRSKRTLTEQKDLQLGVVGELGEGVDRTWTIAA
jgi:hypothetical protein